MQVHADGGVGGFFSLTHYVACAGLAMDVSFVARAVGATWVVRLPLWQPLPVATVPSVFDGVFYGRVDGDGAFNVPDAGGGRLRRHPQCVAAPRRPRLGGLIAREWRRAPASWSQSVSGVALAIGCVLLRSAWRSSCIKNVMRQVYNTLVSVCLRNY